MKTLRSTLLIFASSFFSLATAMYDAPSLERLAAHAASKDVSTARFCQDSFIKRYRPIYPQLGRSMLDKATISCDDKAVIAQKALTEILLPDIRGPLNQTLINDARPFLKCLVEGRLQYELKPSRLCALARVPKIEGSITRILSQLMLTQEQKKALIKSTELLFWSSFLPRYVNHPRVLQQVKTSLRENLDASQLSSGVKKIFAREINSIEPLEEQISKEFPMGKDLCKLGALMGGTTISIAAVKALLTAGLVYSIKKDVTGLDHIHCGKLFLEELLDHMPDSFVLSRFSAFILFIGMLNGHPRSMKEVKNLAKALGLISICYLCVTKSYDALAKAALSYAGN